MPASSIEKISSSKGMWASIQNAPWYTPVLLSLITGMVIAFKAFLNYLNKKQELQMKEKEHILAYKLKLSSKGKSTTVVSTRNREGG